MTTTPATTEPTGCPVTWRSQARCRTLPPEWWDTTDPGARLALALCSTCPVIERCASAGPQHGVIRAGVAWGDTGAPAGLCGCGYPLPRTRDGGERAECFRCDPGPLVKVPKAYTPPRHLPPGAIDTYRDAIGALLAAGKGYRQIGRELDLPWSSVRNVANRYGLKSQSAVKVEDDAARVDLTAAA